MNGIGTINLMANYRFGVSAVLHRYVYNFLGQFQVTLLLIP